jgi:hypothetical protein
VSLIREIRIETLGSTPEKRIFDVYKIGIRKDALTDEECQHCWGSGRVVRGWRSLTCQQGHHSLRCVGNTNPASCICFCHEGITP